MFRPRGRAAPPLALLLLLLLAAALPSALAFEPNFDFYPKDARSCLLDAYTASKCQGDTAINLNGCLCGNGGRFVLRSAQCLGKKDKKDVTAVYDTMTAACNTSKTPLQVDRDDFEEAAGGDGGKKTSSSSTSTATTGTATKTTSSTAASKTASETSSSATSSASSSASAAATATTSSTASPAASPEHDRNRGGERRLSTGATIGIAAGVSIAGVGAIAALAFCLVRRRKRNTPPDESHPMLPPEKYVGAGGPPSGFPTPSPHELSPSLFRGGSAGFDHDAKSSPLSAASMYGGSPQPQNYAALPSASPDLHHQQQHNFLSAWDTQTASATPYSVSPHSVQYVGPYAAPPLPVVAELPSQPRHVSHVFELDSQGTAAPAGASPAPPQPVLQQPIFQQQQQQQPILQQRPSREYQPYIPQ